MKLVYKLSLIVAAAATLTLSSCTKNDDKKEEKAIVPEYKAAAQKVTFSDASTAPVVEGKKLKSVEFTESGLAIIVKEAKAAAAPRVRGGEGEEVIITTYTIVDGVYVVEGFGKIEIKNATATVATTVTVTTTNEAGQEEVQTAAAEVEESQPEPAKEELDVFCTWKVKRVIVSAKGGQLGKDGVGKTFNNGANLDEIGEFLKSKGVNMPDEIKGYSVKDITLTKNGSFIIRFLAKDDFYGSFDFQIPEHAKFIDFAYDLNVEGNSIINAHAEGKITPDGESACIMLIKGNIKNGSDEYTTEVEFNLVKVAKAE